MMTHNVKVGLIILVGVAILIVTLHFVRGERFGKENTYELKVEFENVQGLAPGAKIWLSGVEIGKVEQVNLKADGKAELLLRISEKYKVRRDAEFTIKVGFLKDTILSIQNPEIRPVKITYYKPGDKVVKTSTPASLEDLVGEAHKALGQVNDMLLSVKHIVGDETMKQNIFETVNNIRRTTDEAYQFAALLKQTGTANQDNINVTIANIRAITERLNATAESVNILIENANDIAGDPQVKKQIKDVIATLDATLKDLKDTTESIKNLVTDDEVQQDLRDTIKSTRRTMDSADVALSGFRKVVDTMNGTEIKPSFEFRYNSREDKFHADMNLRLYPPNREVSYMIGLDDLGANSSTSLMLGVPGAKPDLWYRFGIKGGKLGIGADYKHKDMYYEGDLVDPNDLRCHLRVGKELQPSRYVLLGWENALKADDLSIGFMQKY